MQSFPRPHSSSIVKAMGPADKESGDKALFVARSRKMMQVREAPNNGANVNGLKQGSDNYGYGERGITY